MNPKPGNGKRETGNEERVPFPSFSVFRFPFPE